MFVGSDGHFEKFCHFVAQLSPIKKQVFSNICQKMKNENVKNIPTRKLC